MHAPVSEENLSARPMCPGGTYFPRKFCPTGQDILSASRIMCPGLGGKSVRQENVSGPDPIIGLAYMYSYKSSYEPACQSLIKRGPHA